MLSEAINYLKESDDVWKTTILGGVFLLFSFLLIPLFFVWGYVVRVLDRTANGNDEPPVFDDWSELTVDGAKASVILLAYALIPIVVGIVLVAAVAGVTGGEPGSAGAAALVLAGLVTLAVAVGAAYVVPAGLANFASERRIRAGFHLETLRPVLSSGRYAAGWLLAVGIVVVGSFVSGILSPIPFLGPVLGAIVGFYALVAAYYVVGHTWDDCRSIVVDEGDPEPSGERPAI
ncbi:DUF4013 domain-containing protein [Natronobacterium texcoconense]|uniref:DUF4013 domain-containing protein n=1 Tax=Natronobacterium texcoconense TaxID=1095778 RepID=A0A1H1GV36_NATTX|nr:DUF4013 domain-containing protein [Natronobacterium texcoconense]SDR17040.1 Protein of unknown function [Natronobacterium texcoconense]